MEAEVDVLEGLDEGSSCEALTSLEVLCGLAIGASVDKDLAHLHELLVRHLRAVLGKDVEDVANHSLVALPAQAENTHNAQKRVPLEVVLQKSDNLAISAS